MWKRLTLIGNIPEADVALRGKRDEERFLFVSNLCRFLSELKKAIQYSIAKKEKESQKRSYQQLLSTEQVSFPLPLLVSDSV